jgi:hypothetical protein
MLGFLLAYLIFIVDGVVGITVDAYRCAQEYQR